MTKHTAGDFANAKFAEHPNPDNYEGTWAVRAGYEPHAWLLDGVPGNTDEAMASDGWVPVPTKPTITESQYKLALDEGRDPQYVYGFADAMHLFGGEVIPDPEPTNTDKLEQLIRESGFGITYAGEHVDAREFAEHLNDDNVTAPDVKGN